MAAMSGEPRVAISGLSAPKLESERENDRLNIVKESRRSLYNAEEAMRNSALYMTVPQEQDPIVYSPMYDISFLGLEKLHPFDSNKWKRVRKFLLESNKLPKGKSVEPIEAKDSDLLVCHTPEYLKSLRSSITVATICELPPVALLPNPLLQRVLLRPFRFQVGGTVLGAKLAMERGWAINIGGGFHHCSSDQGGGFCAYADISLSIKFAFTRLGISRVLIIDLDAHQGNGHERDFINDPRVTILDIFNREIYPWDIDARQGIDIPVPIKSFTETDAYLVHLSEALQRVDNLPDPPQLIVYNAGTDILEGDALGRLAVSVDGVIRRDEAVFSYARRKEIPIVMVTSGGYQKNNAQVIADSIINLSTKGLIKLSSTQ